MRTAEQEQAFREERRTAIGASDTPAILGISPRGWGRTALTVWGEKVGLEREVPTQDGGTRPAVSEPMEWGHRLESAVIEKWADENGAQLVTHGPMVEPVDACDPQATAVLDAPTVLRFAGEPMVRSRAFSWLACHPDAFVWDPERGLGVLQAKTTNAFNARAWKDGIPLYYRAQLQHEMEACRHLGVKWAAVACLMGGNSYTQAVENPSQRFTQAMLRKLEEFWDLVLTRKPPPATMNPADAAMLDLLFPEDEDAEAVRLGFDQQEQTERIWFLQEKIREMQEELDGWKNLIRESLGHHSRGILPDGSTWTWKKQERKGYTKEVKPWTGRVLRAPKPPK